ncbi:protein lifeguard 1-like [Musca autumnalis]|uniref:protein lifeguard 1-like n=1 Tax=Musca autumnalis TaxID=221902 RepID=UPI003CFB361C
MRSAGGLDTSIEIEQDNQSYTDFENDLVRRRFIRKSYLILAAQLLVTMGLVTALVLWDAFYEYIEVHPMLIFVALGILLVISLLLSCCSDLRRKSPINYICLIIFTLAQTFLLAVVSCRYDTKVILMAAGSTALICVALSLFAMQTKWDFTPLRGVLLISLIVLLILGLLLYFFRSYMLMIIYCSIGVFVYSVFIIYDTQLMVGGNHAYAIGPDEHVFAALNLYIDILQIFLFLLHIIGCDN